MKTKSSHAKLYAASVLFALLAALVSNVSGGVISSRTELDSALGAAAVTEHFESYIFPTNSARSAGPVLDSGSVLEGQGPGLIQPGVRFLSPDLAFLGGIQWDRQFDYGLQSAALVANGRLIIDFTNLVTHVGFEMFWYTVAFPPANPSTIQVFAADDVTLLYTNDVFEPYAPNSFFFGFTDNGGIGRIVMFRQGSMTTGVSPIIDDLTFGTAPSVPSTPSLAIALDNQQVVLSWPELATGFQLEASTNLTPPINWVTVTNTPVPLGGQNTVTLPATNSCKFFRLHTQL